LCILEHSKQSPNFGSCFGEFKVKPQNPSFCSSGLSCNFKCLTLRLYYGLVLFVNGLSNGIL